MVTIILLIAAYFFIGGFLASIMDAYDDPFSIICVVAFWPMTLLVLAGGIAGMWVKSWFH